MSRYARISPRSEQQEINGLCLFTPQCLVISLGNSFEIIHCSHSRSCATFSFGLCVIESLPVGAAEGSVVGKEVGIAVGSVVGASVGSAVGTVSET